MNNVADFIFTGSAGDKFGISVSVNTIVVGIT